MLYAITDRRFYGMNEEAARQDLLEQTALWAAHGVSFVQLREKDLPAREQVELARTMQGRIREAAGSTRLIVNGRPDIALAAGADGVHLPSGPAALTAAEVRKIFARSAKPPYISVACHTLQEVEAAREQRVDCILFAPVFEKIMHHDFSPKQRIPGSGLALLTQACRAAAPVPVFALGGVNKANALSCLQAGAAGIAAIRLMQGPADSWADLGNRCAL